MRCLSLFVVAAILTILSACASVSEVTQLGKDTYMVDATTRGGFQSHGETTALAVNKAREFCSSKGKELMTGPARTSGARGWTPVESTLTFQCLDASDPEYVRPNLVDIAPNGKSAPN
ncbi:hypothetical protein AWB69_00017 [Caballeronia udeis]|uniref:Lipoprotein n=1 Tax=Caballeronia udeis TaxID=1232866 RepID=A0A158EP32_9BURK|nr:hypothetical protein AWB69_00017 [Caballeronia udeis]